MEISPQVTASARGPLWLVNVGGRWNMEEPWPEEADAALTGLADQRVRELRLEATDLGQWDTSLLVFLVQLVKAARARELSVELDLPEGLKRLLHMAFAVPAQEGAARKKADTSFLYRMGDSVASLPPKAADFLNFCGEVTLSLWRLFLGRAKMRPQDFVAAMHECGVQALPIISLTSLLFGLILAFVGAVQLTHNIYKNEYQLGREFELGRSRIVANADKLVTPDPEGGVMRLKDDVFVGLDGDTNDKGLTIFSPALRDESFERRKQSYLKACENIIGLKRGILSDVEAVERTAKEISSSEGDYSLSIMDLQRMWYDALLETLRITDLWGQALGLCDAQAVDLEQLLSVSWGNGVLYDADKDWADTLSMVEAGLLKPELALAKKYDLPCETPEDLAAIREKYMPEMVQLTAQAGLR